MPLLRLSRQFACAYGSVRGSGACVHVCVSVCVCVRTCAWPLLCVYRFIMPFPRLYLCVRGYPGISSVAHVPAPVGHNLAACSTGPADPSAPIKAHHAAVRICRWRLREWRSNRWQWQQLCATPHRGVAWHCRYTLCRRAWRLTI